jgi:ESS family glutamate:Na+ symporter
MTIPAWLSVVLALPVLLLGEFLVRRVQVFRRFNIPEPVIGGLLISLVVLGLNLTGLGPITFLSKVTAQWWTWVVTIEPEWMHAPAKSVSLPLLVAFFTCIGLNASADLMRKGGLQVVTFLALATVFSFLQNGIGVLLAKLLGENPLLGLMCGSITLTGGHGTAMGFAPLMEKMGLQAAAVLGAAAATVGVVAGGLIGGPVGSGLIHRYGLQSQAPKAIHLEGGDSTAAGILTDFRSLRSFGWNGLRHLLLLLACVKAGAWLSHYLELAGATFPPQMGAMIVGVIARNAFDLSGHRWMRTEIIDVIASVLLGLFLTVAMMSLNLIDLANAAVPMLVILAAQVAGMAAFAYWVTYRWMGRDYDAAVMAGGHCGFALGATSNAIASMKVLVERFGPAPRAFLVIPLVGAVLIDFTNALNITFFLNLLK